MTTMGSRSWIQVSEYVDCIAWEVNGQQYAITINYDEETGLPKLNDYITYSVDKRGNAWTWLKKRIGG